MKTKNIVYIAIVVLIIVVVGLWAVFFGGFKQADVQEINTNSQTLTQNVALVIDYKEGNQNTFDVKFTERMTAFSLLQSEAEKAKITLKTKNYDTGVLIEAIGDTENGQDGKYWLYYVNGQMANVSADKNLLKPGDKVEFKFEKYGDF